MPVVSLRPSDAGLPLARLKLETASCSRSRVRTWLLSAGAAASANLWMKEPAAREGPPCASSTMCAVGLFVVPQNLLSKSSVASLFGLKT